MYWFIAAFIVASAIFVFAPSQVAMKVNHSHPQRYLPLSLLILPGLVMNYLVLDALSNGPSYSSIAALGFVATACLIARRNWHKYIMLSAVLTALSLLVMVIVEVYR
ncbi:MAG: hypothetical protein ACRDA8_16515 [Shewanella sp.]